MTAIKLNEYAPQVVQRFQRPVIKLGDTAFIADILVEYVPITGGINHDIKLVNIKKEGNDYTNRGNRRGDGRAEASSQNRVAET